jgi:hypothetical protein
MIAVLVIIASTGVVAIDMPSMETCQREATAVRETFVRSFCVSRYDAKKASALERGAAALIQKHAVTP